MDIWKTIQIILNNREIALLIWIVLILLIVLLTKLRKTFFQLVKVFINKNILMVYSLMIGYLLAFVFLLKCLGIWQVSNLKDVVFWFCTVGFVLVLKINDVKSNAYIKGIILSAIKWSILLEFVINLHSFSLVVEIIILPLFIFIYLLQTAASKDKKYKVVSIFLNSVIALIGISLLSYSLYMTVINYDDILTYSSLISLLLPSLITIVFIPYVYLLALYCTYETYFVDLNFMTKNKNKVKEVKKQILITANINLEKLLRIKKNFEKKVFYEDTNIKNYIFKISKKSYTKTL